MLDSDFFRLVRLHLRLDVEEGLHDGASLGVHFFLGDEGLGGQSEFVVVLNVDHQEDGVLVVLGEDCVDLTIVGLEGGARGVPAQELFFLADLSLKTLTFFIMRNMVSWYR